MEVIYLVVGTISGKQLSPQENLDKQGKKQNKILFHLLFTGYCDLKVYFPTTEWLCLL